MTILARLSPERLDRIVESCLAGASAALSARALGVTRQVSADVPEVRMDRDLVGEAVAILVSRAIQAARHGARLRVTVKSSRNALMLAVKAPGSGLSEAQRDALFAGEATKGGLARALAIVAAHGGMAWANAKPGRGVTFYMTLPAHAAGAGPPLRAGTL